MDKLEGGASAASTLGAGEASGATGLAGADESLPAENSIHVFVNIKCFPLSNTQNVASYSDAT